MSLPPGTRLGGFEISSLLGVGGMGEVYRATDTNLKRQVAIKVLPAAFAGDTDRLGRFEREAQVLAALNHPGIAAIYGLERRDGTMALVMELVEGPTLADRIAHGPIPVADALRIAKQIAEALEAAHEQGIVHRDLKPANVKVRPDGAVKILDFGLAKALASDPASAAAASATMSPTLSIQGTQAGVILGTAAYMSPEQAAGKPVDKRSDLWAFGVVLLEMLTGRQVFAGETVSHVLAAVLMQPPDLSALPADTPAPIRKLLRRCLEKDRKNRLADAADARLEIDDALAGSPQDATSASAASFAPIAPPPVARTRTTPLIVGLATGILLAVAALVLLLRTRPATRALIGISSGGPARAMTYTPLSFEPGGNTDPIWSPDGKGIAFAARQSEDEPYQVYVRYLDSSTSTQLTHADANARPIAWTTTGRIVFRSTVVPAGLWTISQTGGQAEPLLRVDIVGAASATVSRDGSVIAYYAQQDGKYGVWISAPAGSPPKRYAPAPFEVDALANPPAVRFSPDGKQLLLFRNTVRAEEAWLMPYPPDPSRPPRRIFDTIQYGTGTRGTPTFSWMPDNRRVVMARASASEPSGLYMADTVSGELSLLSSGTTPQFTPAVSPDGTRLAFTESTGDLDVLRVDVGTGEISPLVSTRRDEQMPAWAMKAAVLAYVSDRTGEPAIWLREPGRPDRPVISASGFPTGATLFLMSPMVSPDGTRIIFERVEATTGAAMWLLSLTGGAPVRVTDTASPSMMEVPGGWSPDGAWFVYWSIVGTTIAVDRVRTTGQGSPEELVSKFDADTSGNAPPAWSPTGEWVLHDKSGWRLLSPDGKTERDLAIRARVCGFSRDGGAVYCVRTEGTRATLFSRSLAGGPEHVIAKLAPNQVPASSLTPALRLTLTLDGRHVTFSASSRSSSLWLLNGIGTPR